MCETLEIPLTQPCPIFPFRSPANLKKNIQEGGGKRRQEEFKVKCVRLVVCV